MRINCKVVVVVGSLLSNCLVAAYADNVQNALDNQARSIQNQMNRGQISPTQAVQMENQVYNVAQQSQVDRAMNGGHLNGFQQNQLGAQMQGVRNMDHGTIAGNSMGYGNGYNNNAYGYNNGSFSHHHNWAQSQNQGYGAPPPWTQGNSANYQQMGNNWQNQNQNYNNQSQSGMGNMLRRLF